MKTPTNKQLVQIVLAAAVIVAIVTAIAIALKEPAQQQVIQPIQPAVVEPVKPAQPKKPEPTSEVYSKKVKMLLKQDLKTVDAHLAIEGSTKWLFITVDYSEWRSMGAANRKEMVNLLLRHMKQNYSDDYSHLQVSVGVNADQPLAEGKWSPLGNPEIELIGE